MTVSQPMAPSSGATAGSATVDTVSTIAAARPSTQPADTAPWVPAAAAPTISSAPKPAGSASGAASLRRRRCLGAVDMCISLPVQRP